MWSHIYCLFFFFFLFFFLLLFFFVLFFFFISLATLSDKPLTKWKRNNLYYRVRSPVPQLWNEMHRWNGQNIQHETEWHQKCAKTVLELKSSETCFNKSAVTDHIANANHVIDWERAKVLTGRTIKDSDKSKSPHVKKQDQGDIHPAQQAFVYH